MAEAFITRRGFFDISNLKDCQYYYTYIRSGTSYTNKKELPSNIKIDDIKLIIIWRNYYALGIYKANGDVILEDIGADSLPFNFSISTNEEGIVLIGANANTNVDAGVGVFY